MDKKIIKNPKTGEIFIAIPTEEHRIPAITSYEKFIENENDSWEIENYKGEVKEVTKGEGYWLIPINKADLISDKEIDNYEVLSKIDKITIK